MKVGSIDFDKIFKFKMFQQVKLRADHMSMPMKLTIISRYIIETTSGNKILKYNMRKADGSSFFDYCETEIAGLKA